MNPSIPFTMASEYSFYGYKELETRLTEEKSTQARLSPVTSATSSTPFFQFESDSLYQHPHQQSLLVTPSDVSPPSSHPSSQTSSWSSSTPWSSPSFPQSLPFPPLYPISAQSDPSISLCTTPIHPWQVPILRSSELKTRNRCRSTLLYQNARV
jgi:hypothetical protein